MPSHPASSGVIRVMLVDDHQIFREALASLLSGAPGVEVVAATGSGAAALTLATTALPDVICMDVGMPDVNGIEATRSLLAIMPQIKVIALSSHTDQAYVTDMLAAGALGYVAKAEGARELLRAIDAVSGGRQYLSQEVAGVVIRTLRKGRPQGDGVTLGARELQVLARVAQGKSSAQIAVELEIATGTVDVHRRNIMRKLDLHNAVELTRYAINAGLVRD